MTKTYANKVAYIVVNKRNNKVVRVYNDFQKLFLSKDYAKCGINGKYELVTVKKD